MDSAAWIVVGISAAYLVASLIVGSLPGRKSSDTATGYVAGDRTMGLVLMYFITGATIFSAFAFLGAPGATYKQGTAAFYILGYGALGFLPMYFLGPRAARLGRRYGFVTQAELVAHRFRMPKLAGVMALLSAAGFIPYLALQMKGAGYVLNAMTRGGVSQELGSGIVYAVVTLYVLKSGVLGIGWTNTFQGIFMMALAWGLGLYLPEKLYGGVPEMFDRLAEERPDLLVAPGLAKDGVTPWTWGQYSGAVLVSILGFVMWPHLFMKAFTARNEKTLKRTVVLYPTFQIFLVPLFLIGYAGVLFTETPIEKADQILPHILMSMEGVSPYLVGLFCAGALAASMSSGDAMVHAAASIVVRDGVVTAAERPLDPAAQRRLCRIFVVVLMVLAYVFSIAYTGSLVILLLSTYGVIVQFVPGVYAALYARRVPAAAVFVGMLVGSVVTVALLVKPDWQPVPLHAGLWGLMVNLAIVVGATLLRPAPVTPDDDEFLRVAGTPQD